MKEFTLVLLAGAMLALFFTDVQAKTEACNSCSYEQLREGVEYMGDGLHTIYNINTGQSRRFQVTGWDRRPIEIDAEGITVTEYPPDPDVGQALMFLKDFSVATAGTLKTAVQVQANQLGVTGLDNASAYDVMTDANLRTRLGDRLILALPDVPQLDRLADKIVQAGLSKIGMSDKIQVEITVIFKDGSKVVYVETPSTSTTQYQPGRSRTPGGQLIPEANTVDNQGTWTGGTAPPNDDLIKFGDYMRRIGADFQGSMLQCTTRLVCSWDGSNLLCRPAQCQ